MEKTQDFFFTFGLGTILKDKYAKINGTFESSREEMFRLFGSNWCMQHTADDFDGEGLTEIEDNKKQGESIKYSNTLEETLKDLLGDYVQNILNLLQRVFTKSCPKNGRRNFFLNTLNLDFRIVLVRVLSNLVKIIFTDRKFLSRK